MRRCCGTLLALALALGLHADSTPTATALPPTMAAALSPAAGTDAAVAWAFYQAFNQGDQEAQAALLSQDFRSDAALPGLKPGPAALVDWLAGLRTGFPDGQVEILDVVAQGGEVAVRYRFSGTQRGRFLSLRPTRKHASVVGMDLWTVKDHKLVSQSGTLDSLGLLVQLGIAPALH
ncbi:MAG TPA: ester cyclase [bacterium]|jgi:steroid delta-isomerase-like uncharacterized protein|nr:ester cyclase [bacterium]